MSDQTNPSQKPLEKREAPEQGAQKASAQQRETKAEAPEKSEDKLKAIEARLGKVEALEKRIEELEGQKKSLIVAGAAAVIAVICAVVAVIYACVLDRPLPPPKIVTAESLVVSDPEGRFRAEIGKSDAGWGLFLYDAMVTRDLSQGDSGLAVAQAELRVGDKKGNSLILRGPGKYKSIVDLGVNNLGWPCVSLFDKEAGARRADLGETQIPSEGKLEKRSPASLVLTDNQGTPVWKAGETAEDFAPLPSTPVAK
jgi:hypothetical protein